MSEMGFMEKLLDGVRVEWLRLGEIGELVRGNGLPKTDFTENGVPAIHYGQIYTYYGNETVQTLSFVSSETAKKLKKVNKGDVVITNTSENLEDVGKALLYLGEAQAVTGGHATIFKPDPKILGKYFVYCTQHSFFFDAKRKLAKGTKVIDVSATDMAKIKFPIPCPDNSKKSLEIQAEIVRILDAMTAHTAELTAELTARKKQYNYYRDKLLSFEDGGWKTLDEVCTSISAGGDLPENYSKGQIEPSSDFPYPIYANATENRGLYGFTDGYRIASEAVTISARGAKIGYHAVRDGRFTPIIRLITLVPNKNIILARFLDYALNMTPIEGTDGGIPQLTVPTVKKIIIPFPCPGDHEKSLAEQARIVAILDKFNTLTMSLTEGLPREIELRQKQYAYYRDLLLNFPKPEKNRSLA